MKRLLLAAVALTACVATSGADETALAPDFSTMDWILAEIDGTPPAYSATLNLGEPGRIFGQAPCNRYFAEVTREAEAFRAGAIGATRMACPDLTGEADFFQILGAVTKAEQGPGVLILSGGGHQMRWVQPID